jgi:cell division protein FtsI (penicillin-binding protein 3)
MFDPTILAKPPESAPRGTRIMQQSTSDTLRKLMRLVVTDGFGKSAEPMNAPRYAVYTMLDEPHANASTHGYATAGWVAAPAAGRVIARIGPMLGMLPDLDDKEAIQQALYIPLQPGRPAGAGRAAVMIGDQPKPQAGAPATKPKKTLNDLRHEARLEVTPTGGAHAVPAVADR